MITIAAGELGGVPFKYLGDWTDRIAKGELPFAKPTRPQGVERNIVVTLRDWMNDKQYLHDLIASDRRYPTVNAYGPLYGSVRARLQRHADPRSGQERRDDLRAAGHGRHAAGLGPGNAGSIKHPAAVALLGRREHLGQQANNHNSMFDRKGRVWLAATGHAPDNPAFCKKGSNHPSANEFPLESTNRQMTCSIRRPASTPSTRPASARITCSSATTRTTRCGCAPAAAAVSAGSTPRCSTRPATPRSRRAGRRSCSTPTATASATTTPSPASRRIRPRTSASTRRSTR